MKDKILQLKQNCIALDIEGKAKYKLCGTWFGGKPDVPDGFIWPRFESEDEDGVTANRPLSFMAQFNCEDFAKYDSERLLPDHGLLSFFYEMDSQRWGFDPKDKGCARVFWFEDTSALTTAEFPDDLEDDFKFPMVRVKMEKGVSFPSEDDFNVIFPGENENDEFEDAFEQATGIAVYDAGGGSQLLGWPDVIQGTMFDECEFVTQGYYMGNPEGYAVIPEAIRKEVELTAHERWRLLLQLDTVECGDFELMFGDCGHLYFYITKEDLKERRFDNIWLISQCC